VFDALAASGGGMYGVENETVYAGMEDFLAAEGIDLVPASGVAVAVLKTRFGKAPSGRTMLFC